MKPPIERFDAVRHDSGIEVYRNGIHLGSFKLHPKAVRLIVGLYCKDVGITRYMVVDGRI